MVNVSDKDVTERVAVAEAFVVMAQATRIAILKQQMKKGDVIEVARLAGMMAAKRTPDLIPLCHPIPLTGVDVHIGFVSDNDPSVLRIEATVRTVYRTGVEMEALTACSAAALTVYDMCKAIDRSMTIESIRLLEKSGGQSGHYVRGAE